MRTSVSRRHSQIRFDRFSGVYISRATEDINDEIDKFIAENTQPQQAEGADMPQQEIPISVEETKPEGGDKWEDEMPSEQPAKKTSKKKK